MKTMKMTYITNITQNSDNKNDSIDKNGVTTDKNERDDGEDNGYRWMAATRHR